MAASASAFLYWSSSVYAHHALLNARSLDLGWVATSAPHAFSAEALSPSKSS
jgi:hypothetical protein